MQDVGTSVATLLVIFEKPLMVSFDSNANTPPPPWTMEGEEGKTRWGPQVTAEGMGSWARWTYPLRSAAAHDRAAGDRGLCPVLNSKATAVLKRLEGKMARWGAGAGAGTQLRERPWRAATARTGCGSAMCWGSHCGPQQQRGVKVHTYPNLAHRLAS